MTEPGRTRDFSMGRGKSKIAVIGYTEHKRQAPFNNINWALAGLNDLYLDLPREIPQANERLSWFQLHDWRQPQQHDQEPSVINFSEGPVNPRDPGHVGWMARSAKHIPLYLMEAKEEVPDGRLLPVQEMVAFFTKWGTHDLAHYFTNSISWMMGLAIMELTEVVTLEDGREILVAKPDAELGVFGVDMMVAGGPGSEYGWQRPSCEGFLGFATGCGIKVTIPKESDLLKSAFQYGEAKQTPYRAKLQAHRTELSRRRGMLQQQLNEAQFGISELTGAINTLDWNIHNWMPGDQAENGKGPAPMPEGHKKGHLIIQGQPIEVVPSAA